MERRVWGRGLRIEGDKKGKTQHMFCIYCEPGPVFRAVYVSSHFIFGIFYEIGTINSTIFFRWEN